eukprot:scaffold3218_cov161-Pinguiococcus_pyrenoidosus.AAC.2
MASEDYNLPQSKKNELLLQKVTRGDIAGIMDWILKGADPNVRLTDERTDKDETLLHFAVRSQPLDVVQTLLEKGADRTLTDDLGQTPLHYASKRPKSFITTLLEEHGPPANLEDFINAEDAEGNTPLSLAVKASRKVNAETLLRAGALVDTLVQGQTVLLMAIDQGNADIVELVLDHKADPNLRESTTNAHPLHMALLKEQQSVVKMLLEKGADPDAISNEKTCLHVAIEKEDVASTSCLLDHGADPDRLSAGRSPLHIAIEAVAEHKAGFLARLGGNSNPMQIFRLLLTKANVERRTGTEESTPLHIAARTANKALVQELINQGANVFLKDKTGRTPFHVAAEVGGAVSHRKDVLEVLKVENAEILLAKDKDGRTALHQAVLSGQKVEVVEWLLTNGASPDDGDGSGKTPLDLAVDHERWQILLILVAKSVTLSNPEAQGCQWTPLHVAAAKNRVQIVTCVVKYIKQGDIRGFGVDQKDSKGRTPLHVALQNKAEAAAECLLRLGASATIADNKGRTPMHYAAEKNCEEAVKWLIENSVGVNVADSQSRSPLHLAAGARLETMVDLLLDAGGADSKCTDEGGRTPADFCVYIRYERAQTNEAVPEEKASEDVEKGRIVSQIVARLLLAECKGTSKSEWQPIHIAAEKDNAPMVTLLLKHGNSSTAKLPLSGRNPLHVAASCGSSNVTRVLLEHNPTGDYANETDAKGQTALHIAAQAGFERVIEVLVHHGVDVCLLDKDRQSALHLAVIEHQRKGVVQSLVQGQNTEKLRELLGLPNQHRQTALHIAAHMGFQELAPALTEVPLLSLTDNQGRTPADCATVGQHAAVLSYLLSLPTQALGQVNGEEPASAEGKPSGRHGTDETEARTVNALFPDAEMQQWSPLHKAAALKRIDMAEVLLTDAQANIEDQLKRTPLHIAARVGCRPIVQLLLDKGGKVSAKDEEGRTPLHFAAATPGVSTIGAMKALLDAGAIVDSPDALKQTALHVAASVGNDGIVEQLIKTYRANPEAKDTNGQTPLHLASNMNRIRTVASLLKCKAQPNAADDHSRTPLHLAALHGFEEVAEMLIKGNADVFAEDEQNRTPADHAVDGFRNAASGGVVRVLHHLLRAGAQQAWETRDFKVMHIATAMDKKDIVEVLISSGEDSQEPTASERQTPLHIAAEMGCKIVANYLLEQRIDRMGKNANKETPLHLAAANGYLAVVKLLLGVDQDVNLDAAEGVRNNKYHLNDTEPSNDIEFSKQSEYVSQMDSNGDTPLHAVARTRHETSPKIAQCLLLFDADRLARNHQKRTPLHFAVLAESGGMVKTLLEYQCAGGAERGLVAAGSSTNVADSKGQTPLHIAASIGSEDIVENLLEHGAASFSEKDSQGKTPIDHAVDGVHAGILTLLLRRWAELKEEESGWSTLHVAAFLGRIDMLELLMAEDDQQAIQLRSGPAEQTPLQVAASTGNEAIVRFLLARGADRKTADAKKQTALHVAAKGMHESVVRLLLSRPNLDDDAASPEAENELTAFVNSKDEKQQTALHVASEIGAETLVKYLLDEGGARVDEQDIFGRTALHLAAEKEHPEVIRVLLDREDGSAPFRPSNTWDTSGKTPLHMAAANGCEAAVDLLLPRKPILQKRAAPRQEGEERKQQSEREMVERSPADDAAEGKHPVVLAKLLLAYANAEALEDGWKAVHIAAAENRVDMLHVLLEDRKDDVESETSREKRTPLHVAAMEGSKKALEYLLGRPVKWSALQARQLVGGVETEREAFSVEEFQSTGIAAIAATDIDLQTPLHLAAYYGQHEIVVTLIQEGANIYAKDSEGLRAAQCAVLGYERISEQNEATRSFYVAALRALLREEKRRFNDAAEWPEQHYAARLGEADMVDILTGNTKSLDKEIQSDKRTPLHVAAEYGHQDVVKVLVEKGAKLNKLTCTGRSTPLHIAAYHGRGEIVQMLLDSNARNDLKDAGGRTPLHVVAKEGHAEKGDTQILRALVDQKTINKGDQKGATALHIAVAKGYVKTAHILLRSDEGADDTTPGVSADANACDKEQQRPLHIAALHNRHGVAALLLSKGAAIEARDSKSKTALHLVFEKGHAETAKLLLQKGASVEATDDEGHTPFLYAMIPINNKTNPCKNVMKVDSIYAGATDKDLTNARRLRFLKFRNTMIRIRRADNVDEVLGHLRILENGDEELKRIWKLDKVERDINAEGAKQEHPPDIAQDKLAAEDSKLNSMGVTLPERPPNDLAASSKSTEVVRPSKERHALDNDRKAEEKGPAKGDSSFVSQAPAASSSQRPGKMTSIQRQTSGSQQSLSGRVLEKGKDLMHNARETSKKIAQQISFGNESQQEEGEGSGNQDEAENEKRKALALAKRKCAVLLPKFLTFQSREIEVIADLPIVRRIVDDILRTHRAIFAIFLDGVIFIALVFFYTTVAWTLQHEGSLTTADICLMIFLGCCAVYIYIRTVVRAVTLWSKESTKDNLQGCWKPALVRFEKLRKVLNLWSINDMMAASFAVALLGMVVTGEERLRTGRDFRIVASVGALPVWCTLLNYIRPLNAKVATFIMSLIHFTWDLQYLMLVLLVIVFAFTAVLFLLIHVRNDRGSNEDDQGPYENPWEAILTSYRMFLGDFDRDWFSAPSDQVTESLSIAVFVLFLLVSNVLLLNVLIAVVSDSFENSLTRSRKLYYTARLEIAAVLTAVLDLDKKEDYKEERTLWMTEWIRSTMMNWNDFDEPREETELAITKQEHVNALADSREGCQETLKGKLKSFARWVRRLLGLLLYVLAMPIDVLLKVVHFLWKRLLPKGHDVVLYDEDNDDDDDDDDDDVSGDFHKGDELGVYGHKALAFSRAMAGRERPWRGRVLELEDRVRDILKTLVERSRDRKLLLFQDEVRKSIKDLESKSTQMSRLIEPLVQKPQSTEPRNGDATMSRKQHIMVRKQASRKSLPDEDQQESGKVLADPESMVGQFPPFQEDQANEGGPGESVGEKVNDDADDVDDHLSLVGQSAAFQKDQASEDGLRESAEEKANEDADDVDDHLGMVGQFPPFQEDQASEDGLRESAEEKANEDADDANDHLGMVGQPAAFQKDQASEDGLRESAEEKANEDADDADDHLGEDSIIKTESSRV